MIKRDLPLHYTALIMFLLDQKNKNQAIIFAKKKKEVEGKLFVYFVHIWHLFWALKSH